MRTSTASLAAAIAVVAVVLLTGPIDLTGGVVAPAAGAPSAGARAFGHGVSTSLTLGGSAGTHLASPFWGINTADDYAPANQQGLGRFLNSTPVSVIRLGGGDDGYDPTTATEYQAPPSGSGAYVAVSEVLDNFTWFKAWCDARTPHCNWMTYLPGEENSTPAAVHVAEYFHNVLHFVPTYWEFGNEPLAWTHYGLNRTKWTTTDASPVSGAAYATMVHNYITAIKALFPSDRYLGLQNSCACDPSLITTLAKVDGPALAGLAYHEYPWVNGSSTSTAQFFGALESVRNIPNTTAHMQAMVSAGCLTCDSIPISIGEYQAGPVPTHSPLAANYSGAPFIAASLIQALTSNVSTFTVFNIGWLFNTSSGAVKPQGYVYQRILDNMTMGTDYSVQVKAPGVGGVFAVLVKNGTRESLLLVNTNVTRSLVLGLTTVLFPVGLLGSYFTYAGHNTAPIAHSGLTLPKSYTVTPGEILLLNNF